MRTILAGRAGDPSDDARPWPCPVLDRARDLHGIDQAAALHLGPDTPRPQGAPVHALALATGIRRFAYLDTAPEPAADHAGVVARYRVGAAHLQDVFAPEAVAQAVTAGGLDATRPVLMLAQDAPTLLKDARLQRLLEVLVTVLHPGSLIGLAQPCGIQTRWQCAQATGQARFVRAEDELRTVLDQAGLTDRCGPHPRRTWPLPGVRAVDRDELVVLARTPSPTACSKSRP